MKTSKKLVLFGNGKLATGISAGRPIADALQNAGYEVSAHIIGDIPPKLSDFQAEAAVLAAYGRLIPREVLELFPKGIVNIHPSLLPKYRGSTPIESAILDGAGQTGVSLMKLTEKMDAGPLYAQKRLALVGRETKQELADKLIDMGCSLLVEWLPAFLDGSAVPSQQDETEATYTKQLKKADGVMDFGKPAEVLEREVRAFAGWPRSRAALYGHEVIVTKARVAKDKTDGSLVIACQPGYLEIQELIAPSGRAMPGADFLRGYRKS